jgi:hypothetical protein
MNMKIKSGTVNEDGRLENFVNGGFLGYSPKNDLAYISVPNRKRYIWIHNVSASSVGRLFRLACNPEVSTKVLECGQIEFTRFWDFEI